MNVFAPALMRPKKNAAPTQTTEQQRAVRGKISSTETSIKPGSCACGGGCPKCLGSLGIQAKLRIGAPDDVYEQEADRVAEKVMRLPEPKEKNNSQRKTNTDRSKPGLLADNSEISIQRQEELEQEDERGEQIKLRANNLPQRQQETDLDEDAEYLIQAKATPRHTPQVTPNIAANIQSLKGGGQPLPANQRHFFESRMGHDFSGVRIHTDSKAADTAQTIQAKAFTLGNDIVFNTGQYSHDNQEGKKLLAHELTHVVQQEHSQLVQMSPIDSYYGIFDDEFYGELSRNGRPGGVQIMMSFLPGERVNASKIGFVQTARLILNKKLHHLRQGRQREVNQNRAITRDDDHAIDSSIHRTDEGVAIDQFSYHINPLYVVGQQDTNNGGATLSEGEPQSPVVSVPFGTSDDRGFTGFRYDGYGRHGSREGPDDRPIKAYMQDRPTTSVNTNTRNTEMLFETSALAVEGAQAGTYYGSVRWGWRVDGQGLFNMLPMTLVSMGAPSHSFLAAGEIWNRGFDFDDRSNIELPIPEIRIIAPQSVPIYQNPDDSILGIPPQGVLSPGTRIEQLGDMDDLMLRVRVVDCPPLRGYVDNLSGSFAATRSGSQTTITRTTPVFSQPQDMTLGIDPIGILEHAQNVQVLGSDQMASLITVNSCDLMGQEGYIDNLNQTGHQDERPSLSDAGTSGRAYMGPISSRHVVQGRLADCYLLASLISLSQTIEGQIQLRNSLRELEDGNFNVRLFTSEEGSTATQERWVRVGPIQSTHRGAREVEGGAPDESRWVQAIELAYAELRGRGEIANIGRPGVGGREIGGARAALSSITGLEANRNRITEDLNPDELWQQMQRALEFGQPLVAGTGSQQEPDLGIYSEHNYSIMALLSGNGTERFVRIRTPWLNRFRGEGQPGISNHPVFEIPFTSFVENFIQVDFGSPTSTSNDSCPISLDNSTTSSTASGGEETVATDRLLVLRAATTERIRLARGATTDQSELERLQQLQEQILRMTADQLIAEHRRARSTSSTVSNEVLTGSMDLQPSPESPIANFRSGVINRSTYQELLRSHRLFLLMEHIRRRLSPATREIDTMLQHIGAENIHWRAFPSMAANAAAHTSASEPPRITIILGEAMVLLLDRSRFSDMEIILLEEIYHVWDRVNEQVRPRFSSEEMREITQGLSISDNIAEDAVDLTERIETELFADLVQLSALHRSSGRTPMGVSTRRGHTFLSNFPGPLRRTLARRVSDLHRFLGSDRGLRAVQQIIARAENETHVDEEIVSLLRDLVRSEFNVN